MPKLDSELVLKSPPIPDGSDDSLKYDPHLQEETLRKWAKKGVTPETYLNQKRDLVDVIAKLKRDGGARPKGLDQFHRIGKRIVTGAVAARNIWKVRKQVDSLKAALPVHLHLFNSVPAIRCDLKSLDAAARDNGNRYPNLDGSDVIVGIVDFGCDFRHQNFRHSSGTRILYLWDQNAPTGGDSQTKLPYGREISSEMIDRALAAGDENAYQVLGYTPPIAAHGTHVMDIAAGNGREPNLFNGKPGNAPPQPSAPGVAPHAQIIFVNLKSFERSFLGNSRCLLEAVAYIFEKADALGKPAVVNLSLSTTGGPHDGTTLVEQGFEELVNAKAGRAIVTSAGNAFLMKSHLSGNVCKGKPVTIQWNTDPRHTDSQEGVKNEIEIWYPKGNALNVNIYAPGSAKPLGPVSLGQIREIFDGDERVGRISHREEDPNNHDNHIDIRLPQYDDPDHPWRIELENERENEGESVSVDEGDKRKGILFHAWIEQSERGLSRFVETGEDDSYYTLGSISCGNGTLTVGAFDTFEKAILAPPYIQTSAGPIRKTAANKEKEDKKELRPKPELSAPGVGIVAARAQGGVTVMTGSSMAAPHVTGLVALLFQLAHKSGRGPLTFSKTCNILTEAVDAVSERDTVSARDPELRLGIGRINGAAAIQKLFAIILRSVSLEIKVSDKDLKAFVKSNPDAKALTRFLNTHTYSSKQSTARVLAFVSFIQAQVKTDNFVRLTMELLS
jgi:subtilisin family serine protease